MINCMSEMRKLKRRVANKTGTGETMNKNNRNFVQKLGWLFLIFSIFILSGTPVKASKNPESVTIQLNWKNQFQFAGYYVARELGFYRDVGLTVFIREFDTDTVVTEAVLSKRAQFGVGRASLILESMKGKPITLLSAIFQHSPFVLLSKKRSDLQRVADLKGKRIMVTDDAVNMASITAMLTANGIRAGDFIAQKHTFDIEGLISGDTAAIAAYISNEPYQMGKRGLDYTIFSPRDQGFDFYSDILFTSREFYQNNPELVARFNHASLKGWERAFSNIEETVDLILKKYNTQNRSRDALLFEANRLKKLAYDEGIALGDIKPERVKQIAQVYRLLGLANQNLKIADLIFMPEKVSGLDLTPEERVWLQKHPVIRVHNEMEWAPINFNRNGKPLGFSIDVMNLLAEKAGLKVSYISGPSWDEFMSMIKDKKLDVMLNIIDSVERREFLNFTDSYFGFAQALFTRKDFPFIDSIKVLAGKKFAVPKGFYSEGLLKNHPEVEVVPVKNTAEAIQAVSNGSADVMLDVMPVVNYLSRQLLITNLKAGGSAGFDEGRVFPLSLGVRKDWTILTDILQKALKSVTEPEMQEIRNRWLQAPEEKRTGRLLLTQKEKKWLQKHPIIRVSSEPDYAPFDFVENGRSTGFSVDYLDLLARRAGLNLLYVQDTWENLIKKAKRKEIDLLHSIFYTNEREAYLRFTEPYKSIINVIYIRDDVTGINSLNDLAHKRVALPKGDSIAELLPQQVPEAEFSFMDHYEQILKSISTGKADATVMDSAVANYLIRKNTLTNIKPAAEAIIPTGDRDPRYRLAVRRDWPELHAILQKSIKTVTRDDMAKLEARWFGFSGLHKKISTKLTADEADWLNAHPVIRVHNELDWPPFNYFEYNVPRGLSIDYMNLLADQLGLKVEYVTRPGWNEFLGLIKNKELDVMLNIIKTPDREKYVLYTPPYIRNPNVIISHIDNPYHSMKQLFGKTVSIPKGFYQQEILTRSFPQIKLLLVEDALSGLKAVAFGKADATLGKKTVLEHLINRNLLTGLKTSGEVDIGNPDLANLRIGIRNDWPLLQSALTKAMAEVTPQQMSQIQQKWILPAGIENKQAAENLEVLSKSYLLLMAGIVVAVGIILLLITWLVSRSKQRDISELYRSNDLRRAGLIIITLSIGIIILLASFRLVQFKEEVRKEVKGRLKTVLETTNQMLEIWSEGKKRELKIIIGHPGLKPLIKQLANIPRNNNSLASSAVMEKLRGFFQENRSRFGEVNFYVISPDLTTIGSKNDQDLGKRDIVGDQRKSILNTAFLGDYVMVPPTRSNLFSQELVSTKKQDRPVMFFAGPVLDDDGLVIAILAIAVNPHQSFTQISQSGRLGRTGETYAFDKQGFMLSESRFNDDLSKIDLLGVGESGILNIKLLDPGKPLSKGINGQTERAQTSLTLMAKQAVSGRNGINIEGYRDYRGIMVVGAWLWNHELDVGIASEIDWQEAFNQFVIMRDTLIFTLGITILMALTLTGFSLWIGQSATRSLTQSKDQLGIRVEERTVELARLEKRFRDLLESAPDSMIIVDESATITLVNAQTEKLFGYGRDELIGKKIEVMIPYRFREGHPAKRNGFIQAALVSPIEAKRELVGLRKNGEEFPVEVSLSPLKTDEGLLVSAAVRDITERILAEDALRESEEKTRLILDNAAEGIFGVDLQGETMFINPAACSLLGYQDSELRSRKIHPLIHHTRKDGTDYPVDECPMKKAYIEGKTFKVDNEVLWKKDGKPVDVIYTSTPIVQDESIIGAVITFQDITEQKRQQAALEAQHKQMVDLVKNLPLPTALFDPKGTVLTMNTALVSLLGYTEKDIPTVEEHWDLFYRDPDYREEVRRVWNAGIEESAKMGIPMPPMDLRINAKSGEVYELQSHTIQVGELAATMWLDFTERNKAEKQLKEKFDELERFRRMAIGRELKMIELKKEINRSLQKDELPEKYKIH